MSGLLSVVATPIGNLEDITLRALRTLGEVDYVLCEDTRVTGKLLAHHGIKVPLRRYDAHVTDHVHEQILADLQSGKHLALVSDAGTPGVSDPGVLLVSKAREAGLRIEAIPGPSALTAALSLAGIAGNQFSFLGFVPQKKGRQTFFAELSTQPVQPVIFFESTHRLLKTLESLAAITPNEGEIITLTVARELTKIYEEVVVDTPEAVLNHFLQNPIKQKGEFVIIFSIS